MTPEHHARGGAVVAILTSLEAWEADLILNLRLWCAGRRGRDQVRGDYRRAFPELVARRGIRDFESLVAMIIDHAHRPIVHHEVGCACVGSDEGIFAHLVRIAADGHGTDAILVAMMLVGPAHAEPVAVLAAHVGICARKMNSSSDLRRADPSITARVVRLH